MSKLRGSGKWRSQGPARSSTGATVRGKSISHPIPFPDDDEFPIRTPGAGLAIPLGPRGTDMSAPTRASTATDGEVEVSNYQTGIALSDYTEPSITTQPTTVPSQPSPETPIRRTIQPAAVRSSMASVPSGSSIGKPQRKKSSSLKTVFGRLFGKKSKQSPPSSSPKQGSSSVRADLHRSVSYGSSSHCKVSNIVQDPTAFNRSPQNSTNSQKRSASLPINEFNRALRSHSVVADDLVGLNSEGVRNGESTEIEDALPSRRATTPSRLWTPTKAHGYHNWTGLSPRPASSHVRGSKAISQAEADAIGTAVTSGSHPNRRSRSLGELREVADARLMGRRRSDEIRYWRASYDPGPLSPTSSNANKTEDPALEPEPKDLEVQDLPQPFNFGPLGEMAGMKITQAANLETRVQRLEERMLRIENMLSRYNQGSELLLLRDLPKRHSARLSRYRSASSNRPTTHNSDMSLPTNQRSRDRQPRRQSQDTTSQSSQKRKSSYESTRNPHDLSLNPLNPEAFLAPEAQVISHNSARPLSTSTTIRGIPSSPPAPAKDGFLTSEHYTALANMIVTEQEARENLESIVINLQQQLRVICSSTAGAYPTAASSLVDPLNEDTPTTGGFSSFENDSSEDEDGKYGQEEIFETPNEEREQFGDEIFGAAPGKSSQAKIEPRTLSLSQITKGGAVQHSLDF